MLCDMWFCSLYTCAARVSILHTCSRVCSNMRALEDEVLDLELPLQPLHILYI